MNFKNLLFAGCALVMCTAAAKAQVPSYVPTDGLVGWWPFNGNANDESGNGNDGVVNGATLGEDRFGEFNRSYSFSGSDYISLPSLPIQGSQSRTFIAWGRLNTAPPVGTSNYFISTGSSVTSGSFNMRLVNGQLGVMGFGTPGVDVGADYDFNIQGNEWNFYAVNYDGDSLRFFFNGLEVDIQDVYPEHNTVGQNNFFGKSNHVGWEYYFNGFLDDIAIYNRALTEQEIQNLYTGSTYVVDSGNGAAPLPRGIPYQAAARDVQGQALTNAAVNVRFTLHEGAVDGAASYAETHTLTTNSVGLFNTVFGSGTPEQSAFDSINWAASTKFLQVEIDLGQGYLNMGTAQLLSVPYAMRSEEAARVKNAGLPIYNDNAAALAGGLQAGDMYRTASGVLMVVY